MGVRISTLPNSDTPDLFWDEVSVPVAINSTKNDRYPYGGYPQNLPFAIVTQVGHSFKTGDAVYVTASGLYALASAINTTSANAVGIVIAIGTGAKAAMFAVQFYGQATIGGVAGGRYTATFTPGTVYYLSSATPGAGTTVAPSISTPLFIAINATAVVIAPQRATPATDLSNYYTKPEVDTLFTGYYSKTDIEGFIDGWSGTPGGSPWQIDWSNVTGKPVFSSGSGVTFLAPPTSLAPYFPSGAFGHSLLHQAVDVSALVPTGTKAAILYIEAITTGANNTTVISGPDTDYSHANVVYSNAGTSGVATQLIGSMATVCVDASRLIHFWITSPNTSTNRLNDIRMNAYYL